MGRQVGVSAAINAFEIGPNGYSKGTCLLGKFVVIKKLFCKTSTVRYLPLLCASLAKPVVIVRPKSPIGRTVTTKNPFSNLKTCVDMFP